MDEWAAVNGMWGDRWRIDLMFPEDAVSAQGKKSWEKHRLV